MSRCSSASRVGSGSDGGVVRTPEGQGPRPAAAPLDHAVAAAGQARIDAQDEHAYDATRGVDGRWMPEPDAEPTHRWPSGAGQQRTTGGTLEALNPSQLPMDER